MGCLSDVLVTVGLAYAFQRESERGRERGNPRR